MAATPSVVGATQARGLKPSTSGIASHRIDDRRIRGAVRRAQDAMNMVKDIMLDVANLDDPVAVEIANRLKANPQFLKTMLRCLEQERDELAASIEAGKATAPAKPVDAVNADPTAPGGEDPHDLASATHPTTDSRASNVYTKDQLMRDLRTQTLAAQQLAITEGMDAADAAVARSPLVPPWDSPRWTADAREAFRQRARFDGWAAEHIRGNVRSIDVYLRGE